MAQKPDIPICILAGGASRRFGTDKALAVLNGKPLLSHILDRVRNQTSGPIAINTGNVESCLEFGLPLLQDKECQGFGPLAGIYTALGWALQEGCDAVITLAVDLPFVPLDLATRLSASGAPSIAATKDRWHPVNGIWQAAQLEALGTYLQSGKRSAHGWAEHCGAHIAVFEEGAEGVDPFWNVNTPDDLAAAERFGSQP